MSRIQTFRRIWAQTRFQFFVRNHNIADFMITVKYQVWKHSQNVENGSFLALASKRNKATRMSTLYLV